MALPNLNRNKSSFIGGVVRGGQITHHNLAMFLQVVKWMYKGGFFCFIAVAFGYAYKTTTLYQFQVFLTWAVARFTFSFNDNPMGVTTFPYPDGSREPIRISRVLTEPVILDIKNGVISNIMAGVRLGAVTFVAVFVLLFFIFRIRDKMMTRRLHIQGSRLVERGALIGEVNKHNRSLPRAIRMPPFFIDGIPMPSGAETYGVCLTGAVGAGKTNAFHKIISEIRRRGESAIIYDRMGTFTMAHYDPFLDVILNPFDKRSHTWDLFADIRMPSDLMMVAEAFIPNKEGDNPLWAKGARIIFTKMGLREMQTGNPSLKRLIKNILGMSTIDMAALLQDTSASMLIDPKAPKQALGFRAMLAAFFDPLEQLPTDGPRFSVRSWIEDPLRGGFLFIPSRADIHAVLKPLITAWIEIATNTLLTLEGSKQRRRYFGIDELTSLNRIPSLPALTSETRQKGGCPIIAFQNFAQGVENYGKETWEGCLGNLRTRVIFSTAEESLANWSSLQVGDQLASDFSQTYQFSANQARDSQSLNERRERLPLALPSDIMDMPNLRCYVRFPNDIAVGRIDIRHQEWPTIAAALEMREDVFQFPPLPERLMQYLMGTPAGIELAKSETEGQEGKPEKSQENAGGGARPRGDVRHDEDGVVIEDEGPDRSRDDGLAI
ncbi:type IV secretion system DNA-binding domain-containing protein [Nitrospirillum amazonense]|uniref:type IV secretion system DNA-binding domain-containing protein n=1 Tax=Nitrospirillum amazonense TaxID=28077 RepID=UPI0024128537|nr:type IV secretion system DNA-binding domain-containing protein [Nitrospirillum amazonense]MDG3443724.1 type IV secretion system DNA-binding domain-containing protein [Nitrospirillum amazonense]